LSIDGLTVTDNVTGLIWQQSSDINGDGIVNYDDKLYQSEAISHCDNLSLAGRDDWRLPSIKEAFSLILFSGKDASSYQGNDTSSLTPFIHSIFDWAFGDLDSGNDRIIDAQYASSTLYLSTTMNADRTMFGVNYVDGRIKGYPTEFKEYYVRCVTGNAGVIEILDWQSNVIWSTTVASETYLSHHDVEQLPNGNILTIVWESKTSEEALALGRTNVSDESLWAGAIYEICRSSAANNCADGEIVWRWSIWDHIVQDVDSSISSTYVNDISAHTDKVNLNFYSGSGAVDWTHMNAVDYNPLTDQILISVHNFSEYWVIQHSDASQGNILVFNNGANRPEGDYSGLSNL